MVWDIVPCPEENIVGFMPKVNLVPGSDEGNTVEHRASHERLAALQPVYRELMLAAETAGAVMGTMLVDQYSMGVDDEEKTAQVQQTMQISLALCQAVIANLVDYGYLHLPHRTDGILGG